ncbi:helix-turn-helix domain-containing protein [Streptomyces phyllanthi]|uniref:Helix-turn-helix domain-containing protein n=2 Tax=Streptomyces phyllanthi TaxID=1803180 RepID=A0A5N8WFB3_9ACTN|nr:helix-turn-helix domain-containing protein [Streptomyces phyllanthi]
MLKDRAGVSFEVLAQRTGAGRSSLHRYCAGTHVPVGYGLVHSFAKACGATGEELRELHRLWALADAARSAEDAAEASAEDTAARPETQGAGERRPEADGGGTGDGGSRKAGAAGAEGDGHRERGPEPVGSETVRSESVGSESVGVEPAGPEERSRAEGGAEVEETGLTVVSEVMESARSGRRMLPGVAAAVLIAVGATLGVALWPESSGGGRSAREEVSSDDGRLLFSAACEPVVSMGQHDACVREVQTLLRKAGGELDVDSDFGPQTLRRVTAFQVMAELPPKGIVDKATKRALYAGKVDLSTWAPEKVERRIREVFPEEGDRAVAIARCQSFLDPLHILPNTNGTRNWGVFQIADVNLKKFAADPRQALDPEWNIQAARRLWSVNRDFSSWPHCDQAFRTSSPSASPSGD